MATECIYVIINLLREILAETLARLHFAVRFYVAEI